MLLIIFTFLRLLLIVCCSLGFVAFKLLLLRAAICTLFPNLRSQCTNYFSDKKEHYLKLF